ncbi:hypothetical protein [Tumebacillus flagellatus]|uniref:Uncharacterized protein n=1 Tax=Tumebacillus flagellatus TaxID=1157490 RepID=A0A074MC64_9BACL|nr:hypothetical protein [Tumebacillus flagellatus]KEO83482.1 hypothetical protein EL26_09705 [Tumebacillus flagellatus]
MAKEKRMVEYGYDPNLTADPAKGTIIVPDAFGDWDDDRMQKLVEFAEVRSFAQIVLFPHHEKTLKSMGWPEVPAFHKRVKELQSLVDDLPPTAVKITLDVWEEKRKKYTPLELIVRYLEEKYRPPFFLYVSDAYANAMAGFASFDELIRNLRLVIETRYGVGQHPKLAKVEHRWEQI